MTTRIASRPDGPGTRGILYVHSAPSALCPHIEWAVGGVLGVPVSLDWTPQPAQSGTYRAELSWAGDGREGGESGAGRPYTVLASADPSSFVGAKEVEVAGHSLVTDLPLPAARASDRKITYFRIQ